MDEITDGKEVATLAGGCFWCLEAVFDDLIGVEDVVSGYSGGKFPNPTYKQVCTGATGHAEVIQVTFDPARISYKEILEVFFTIHDPTTLNRQGGDVGTQYRSAIFYHSPEQKATAEQVIQELNAARVVGSPNRDRNPAIHQILPGRGLPPGILRQQRPATLLPDRDRSQGRQVPQALSGTVESIKLIPMGKPPATTSW